MNKGFLTSFSNTAVQDGMFLCRYDRRHAFMIDLHRAFCNIDISCKRLQYASVGGSVALELVLGEIGLQLYNREPYHRARGDKGDESRVRKILKSHIEWRFGGLELSPQDIQSKIFERRSKINNKRSLRFGNDLEVDCIDYGPTCLLVTGLVVRRTLSLANPLPILGPPSIAWP